MRSIAIFFLIVSCVYADSTDNGILPVLEEKMENKFTEYAGGVTKWLESFNDEHLGKTELGRYLHYNAIKSKLEESAKEAGKEDGNQSRSMKKMGMTMMPLIFHIGATSTWMLITTVLAAKSLAVGLMLLIFKIAVSSAKLAAFFTQLKGKNSDHHGHHEWAWTPHYEHHDHHLDHALDHHGTISHIPDWTSNEIPHTIHDFKNNDINDFKPHEFNEYKTIPTHAEIPMLHEFDMHGLNGINPINGIHEMHPFDGSHNNFMGFNHFEGAKKKIDSKVE